MRNSLERGSTDVAGILHGKTEFMDSDETALQEQQQTCLILKFGEGIITLTSLITRVMGSIICILGAVLGGNIICVSIDNSQ